MEGVGFILWCYLNRAAMAEGHREAILVVNMHPFRAVGA